MIKTACLAAALLATPAGTVPASAAATGRILVFAAVSLTDALTEAADGFAKSGHAAPIFSFASSATLARQIENGAPAAIFMSADEQWMDYVADRKLIAPGTRTTFLGNTLVLVTPADRPMKADIYFDFPLAKMLGAGKLAMGDPDSVPAGKYAKAALESLGLWRAVGPNVVRADNVRAALAFVERGEAAAGIVYATDVARAKKVAVAGSFPEGSYPPVSYPVAIVAGQDTPEARAFATYVQGAEARAVFVKYGFRLK